MVMDFLRRSVRRAAAERGLYLSVTTLLALGIGASTTVFSVVDATVLRPLPFPEPEELVFLTATLEGSDGEIQNFLVSPANYVVMRDRSTAFRAVEAIRASAFDLLADGEPVQVSGAEVTPGFFEALRATPVAGRLLTETDVDDAVAVLGEGAWARHFGRDPGVVGRTVDLGSVPTRIVGVLPDHLALPRETEVWRTFRPEDVRERDQHGGGLQVIGRLASDVALSTAQADMDRIAGRLRELYPRGNSERGIEVQDLKDSFVEDTEGALRALLASVLIFMAIACANVSGLLLLRVRRRASDTALRLALGAPRSRLLAGALLEGVGMSAVGTGAGLALAAVAVPRLHGVLTVVPPGADPSALDPRVLAAAAILGAGTAVAFALGPALVAAAQAPDAFLGRGRGGTASRGQRRLQQATVGLQVALGVLLVVTATATLGRFLDLTGTRPGYSGTDAVVLRVGASSARYPGFAERSAFFFGLSERFRSIPGVTAVGATDVLPVAGLDVFYAFSVEDRPPADPNHFEVARGRLVTPGYFRALGIPLLKGRGVDGRDRMDARPVVVVSRHLAERYWPGEDPIGKRLKRRTYDSPFPWLTVVGVVDDVQDGGPGTEIGAAFYLPYLQHDIRFGREMSFVLRSARPAGDVVGDARRVLAEHDPETPLIRAATVAELQGETIADERASMRLLTGFALGALLLMAFGLYAVLARAVHERTREIGLRIALGAGPRDVVGTVVGTGLAVVATGLAVGLVAAPSVIRASRGFLGAELDAPVSAYLLSAGLTLGTGLVAALLPALRAQGVDPVVCLRSDGRPRTPWRGVGGPLS